MGKMIFKWLNDDLNKELKALQNVFLFILSILDWTPPIRPVSFEQRIRKDI